LSQYIGVADSVARRRCSVPLDALAILDYSFEERRLTMFKIGNRRLRRMALALGFLVLAFFAGSGARMNKHAGLLPPDVGNVMALYGADAVSIDRNARDFKLPGQFEWTGRPGSASKTATLFGDPSKAGLYVQVTKRGPNEWSQPHSHPNERFITVLAGTFLIGTGPKFDKNNTVAVGPGGVVHDIPNQMHYDGTGPEGATLEFIAMGPAARN
jgi:hypothetical protein